MKFPRCRSRGCRGSSRSSLRKLTWRVISSERACTVEHRRRKRACLAGRTGTVGGSRRYPSQRVSIHILIHAQRRNCTRTSIGCSGGGSLCDCMECICACRGERTLCLARRVERRESRSRSSCSRWIHEGGQSLRRIGRRICRRRTSTLAETRKSKETCLLRVCAYYV